MSLAPHSLRSLTAVAARQTLGELVYSSIRKAIIDGDLRPGERLRETEVAASLGASRTPVREALSRLEQDGLVRSLKTGGSVVVDLTKDEMREIFDLIEVLETFAVKAACTHVTPAQLAALDDICKQAERAAKESPEMVGDLNKRFHDLVIESSGSVRLKLLVGNLRLSMQPYRALTMQSQQFRAQSVRDHRRLLNLIKKGQREQAGSLMSRHLSDAQAVTLKGIEARAERLARIEETSVAPQKHASA